MAAPKGNKYAKGGKRKGAGPPNLLELAVRKSFLEKLEAMRESQSTLLASKYYAMAMEDPATMRHLVDRVLPPAKVEIGVTGEYGFNRETIQALMLSKAGREAAEAVKNALKTAEKPSLTHASGNGNGTAR